MAAPTVKITDTFYAADGVTPFSGQIHIKWPTFKLPAHRHILAGMQTVTVSAGALSVDLWASDQALVGSEDSGQQMIGFQYEVTASTPSGPIVQLWYIATTLIDTTVTLASVQPKWINASGSGGGIPGVTVTNTPANAGQSLFTSDATHAAWGNGLQASNNLSDLGSASVARTNLGTNGVLAGKPIIDVPIDDDVCVYDPTTQSFVYAPRFNVPSQMLDTESMTIGAPSSGVSTVTPWPVSAAGSPTNGNCDSLCAALAKAIATGLWHTSRGARYVMRFHIPFKYNAGGTAPQTGYADTLRLVTPAGANNDLIINSVCTLTQTVAVSMLLQQPQMIRGLGYQLARCFNERIDGDMVALYPAYTANSAVGTGATPLSDANIATAVSNIANSVHANATPGGEPYLLFCHPSIIAAASSAGGASAGVAEVVSSNLNQGVRILSVNNNAGSGTSIASNTGSPVYLIPLGQVSITGTTTKTTNNLMVTPTGVQVVFGDPADSVSFHPLLSSPFTSWAKYRVGGFCAQVGIVNTGSGAQRVVATVAYGTGGIFQRGCQVRC